jgi:hypothetical protein
MKAICPNDPKHNRFYTTAHITQEWAVNGNGDFLESVAPYDHTDVTHGPTPKKVWECAVCGANVLVEE